MSFQKINPIKYELKLNVAESGILVFNQSFNEQWKLFVGNIREDLSCNNEIFYKEQKVSECHGNNKYFTLVDLKYLFGPVYNENNLMHGAYANGWFINKDYISHSIPENSKHVNADGSVDISLILYYVPLTFFWYNYHICCFILFFNDCFFLLTLDIRAVSFLIAN